LRIRNGWGINEVEEDLVRKVKAEKVSTRKNASEREKKYSRRRREKIGQKGVEKDVS